MKLKTVTLGMAMIATLSTPMAALAQPDNGPPIRNDYGQQQPPPPPPGSYAPNGYDNAPPPPEPYAPDGYDGTRPPPPPPGYQSYQGSDQYRDDPAADQRYERDAERWARDNCVKSRGDAGTGAVVGGIFGAIIGSALGGRHSHGAGTVTGAVLGAGAGAVIASNSGGNETSPGCPPGYVVRRGAPDYAYSQPDYYYAAPGWYRPWVFIDGYWSYRPYPYHTYYYRTWRRGPGHDWRRGRDYRDHRR